MQNGKKNNFGIESKKQRMKLGYSLRKVSELTGISTASLSRIENGGQCYVNHFLRLCEIYDLNANDFKPDKKPIKPIPYEVEKEYQDFWKAIIEIDGVIDMNQLKRELYDYSLCMDNVGLVYDHVTGGAVSKITTKHEVVKSYADEHYKILYEGINRDE